MAEYIEREAKCHSCFHKEACLAWMRHGKALYDDFSYSVEGCPYYIPAADVAPVVHCKWIDGADSFGAKRGQYRVCSRCNICIPCVTEVAEPYWQYCPNCGARMDGE